MPPVYYSTKTVLEWLVGHYFFNGKHFAWFAPKFSPYKLRIRTRTNPLRTYEPLYAAWKDQDGDSPFVIEKRLNLRKAIEIQTQAGNLDSALAAELKNAVDTAHPSFFLPLVYQSECPGEQDRRIHDSRHPGSSEFLMTDLEENEFIILFMDFEEDAELRKLVVDGPSGAVYCDSADVRALLNERRMAQ